MTDLEPLCGERTKKAVVTQALMEYTARRQQSEVYCSFKR